MPLYEIHHSCALNPQQQQAIATEITKLHCNTFSAPSIFVNIAFHPTSTVSPRIYVGGIVRRTNYIVGHLRPRPNNVSKLNHIVRAVTDIWNMHVRPGESLFERTEEKAGTRYKKKDGNGRLDDERALHNVFLMEDIVAGAEQGFLLPKAGRDEQWAREHMAEFEQRAKEGDDSMRVLLGEYKGKL